MEITAQLFDAQVMHFRHGPKENGFTYHSCYLSLPIGTDKTDFPTDILPSNKPALISFYDKDHGHRDGSNLHKWAMDILKKEGLDKIVSTIKLITLPRLFGYVFNPVSFWLCLDKKGFLRALISEVNNTFGDTHTYLCAKVNKKSIHDRDWLSSKKLLYVSPFLKREGSYKFRISSKGDKLGIWVNHYDETGALLLSTSLIGRLKPLSKSALYAAFMRFPLTVVKTISLIHWQALIIWLKGIKYVSRPEHGPPRASSHLEPHQCGTSELETSKCTTSKLEKHRRTTYDSHEKKHPAE